MLTMLMARRSEFEARDGTGAAINLAAFTRFWCPRYFGVRQLQSEASVPIMRDWNSLALE
jgi:hypothetical protein